MYILFLFVFEGRAVAYTQYVCILLCVVYALMFSGKGKDAMKLKLALLFTMGADFFLVLVQKDELRAIAMALFVGAQLCYLSRIIPELSQRRRTVAITTHIIIMLALVTLSVFILKDFNTLIVICCLYFGTLVTNVIFAWQGKNRLLSIGITLFLLCDIFVGLSSSTEFTNIPMDWIAKLPLDPIWFFYLPSQMLLSLSINKCETEEVK